MDVKWIAIIVLGLTILSGYGQQTVGTTIFEDGTLSGYTFFAPNTTETAYLVDDCGYVVNSWERQNRPGLGSYLLENGLMLRTNKVDEPFFFQASTGGLVELVDWNNNTVWAYEFNTPQLIQHHDVCYLPNGNILILGWERITPNEQAALGRNTWQISEPDLWGEFIYEVKPIGLNDIEIVWEWHLQDHFIQDTYPNLDNYGEIATNPYRVDINYQGPSAWDIDDWWHCNAIDYNEALDQIVINSRNNNETWIIDHSTTTEESRGSTGGRSGHGGDLLWRWGNPEAYDHGSILDLRMFGSHGQYWIEDGLPRAGEIMYFNNGDDRPEGYYSTVETLRLEPDENGNYPIGGDGRFLPEEANIVYQASPDPFEFRSTYLSNARQLENGNVFINEGGSGRLFEVDNNQEIVWQYINPATYFGIVAQGENASGNAIFRAYKFPADYPAFDDKDLTREYLLEGEEGMLCDIVSTQNYTLSDIEVAHTLTNDALTIYNPLAQHLDISIFDLTGKSIGRFTNQNQSQINIDIHTWNPGIYILHLINSNEQYFTTKIMKL